MRFIKELWHGHLIHTGCAVMRVIKELWHGHLVHYRMCCNDIHKGAMAQASSILQDVL